LLSLSPSLSLSMLYIYIWDLLAFILINPNIEKGGENYGRV
jgi:hypothetical protein